MYIVRKTLGNNSVFRTLYKILAFLTKICCTLYNFSWDYCTLYNQRKSRKPLSAWSYNVQYVLYNVQNLKENQPFSVHCTRFGRQFGVLYSNSLEMYVHFIVHIQTRQRIVHFSGSRNHCFHNRSRLLATESYWTPFMWRESVRREKSPFCALRDTRAASGAVRDKTHVSLERGPSTLRVAHSKFLPSLPHWIGSNASVNVRWLRRINTEAQPTTH